MSVNIERLMNDLRDLGAIGYTKGQGADRMAYSQAFFQGRDFVKARMEAAGLSNSHRRGGQLDRPAAFGHGQKQKKDRVRLAYRYGAQGRHL